MQLNDQLGIGMTSQRTRNRMIARLNDKGITNISVLDAMRITPRHIFVDEALSHRAYEDSALPIGKNQTISQPYIVALMTQILISKGSVSSVLEIGTGCGYQTAILSQLVKRVCTVERIASLQENAEGRLRKLGLRNIEYRHGDGATGWKARAPFDGIIITAAPREIPKILISQLSVGGVMVLPLGDERSQSLQVLIKTKDGYDIESLDDVLFVPLQGGVLS